MIVAIVPCLLLRRKRRAADLVPMPGLSA